MLFAIIIKTYKMICNYELIMNNKIGLKQLFIKFYTQAPINKIKATLSLSRTAQECSSDFGHSTTMERKKRKQYFSELSAFYAISIIHTQLKYARMVYVWY